MKDKCYIIGSGLNGQAHYGQVPLDANVVLCNASVKLLDTYAFTNAIWMCSDNRLVDLSWWNEYYNKYKHLLHGSGQLAERCKVAVEFQENPWFNVCEFELISGVYRGGASIAGIAMQYAYYNNLQAVLIGVDMDKGYNQLLNIPYPEGHWKFKIKAINKLIHNYMPDTVSLSKTVLEVEQI